DYYCTSYEADDTFIF
nr:immunoglobulin light chain junction region [Macaca mulatta]MOW31014.1 immunoglobulin light chain junction region [Macaca mulatta]MOW31053.1 immunoglobulin light chain junction region [Macaca mulatta]MOW31076.1 immunoglobulin light chain junction region [Macaca mulatta]MOW31090.1 immunoglobulin light chain junction region [Macaca mulatta]